MILGVAIGLTIGLAIAVVILLDYRRYRRQMGSSL